MKDHLEAVEAQYTRFPYPSTFHARARRLESLPAFVRRPLRRRLERKIADRPALRAQVEAALPAARGARILDAGCGTGEIACALAAGFPEARVTGLDLSPESVRRARDLRNRLELDNLEIEQGNLLAYEPEERFDLVVAYGVLHHLPDTAEGLRRIATFAGPDGRLLVFLYGSLGRFPLICKREALSILVPDAQRFDDKLALVDALGLAPRSEPRRLRRLEKRLRGEVGTWENASVLVDQLAHVHEENYTAAEILALVDKAGLRFERFVGGMPDSLAAITRSPAVLAREKELSRHERHRVIELLVRPFHYTFIAAPRDAS